MTDIYFYQSDCFVNLSQNNAGFLEEAVKDGKKLLLDLNANLSIWLFLHVSMVFTQTFFYFRPIVAKKKLFNSQVQRDRHVKVKLGEKNLD